MSYSLLSFSPNEILTSAKMNQVSDNFEAVRDGTAILPEAVAASNIGGDYGLYGDMQVFSASGTWTKPAGLRFVVVEVMGGGGAGGGADATGTAGGMGSGGGAGGYSKTRIAADLLSATETVTVGAGGVGGLTTGPSGGNSSFGTHCTANGGTGGNSLVVTSNSYLNGGNGATPGTGDLAIGGGDGYPAEKDSENNNQILSGDGGVSFFGGGGKGVSANNNGGNALTYGAGGGGGACHTNSASQTGGDGAAGVVIVHEYF